MHFTDLFYISDQNIILTLIALCLIVLGFFAQEYYYLFMLSSISRKDHTLREQNSKHLPPVSVIICARDEAENLSQHLISVLEQDYPDFEVIVVNDNSEDNTEDVLLGFKQKYPQLYITQIKTNKDHLAAKKLAVTLGIKAAKNEWLLFTDADCKPHSDRWIKTMATEFCPGTDIVLAYGPYMREKGWLNRHIRTESFLIALQYLSLAKKGWPYMGIGRNLAYRKSLFMDNKGFASHLNVTSGDDDLFINEVAEKDNTKCICHQDALVYSIPKNTWKSYLRQKRRHLSTFRYYKKQSKRLLSIEPFSRFAFYVGLFTLLVLWQAPGIALGLFLLRTISQLIIIKRGMRGLHEKDLLLYSLAYDLLSILIHSCLILRNTLTSGKNTWK